MLLKDRQKEMIGHINLIKLQVIVFDLARDAAIAESVGEELIQLQAILRTNLTKKYIQDHNF